MEQHISNNNQNNQTWKDRIRDYDTLPGEEMPAAEVLWDRLQRRYHRKPAKKSRLFYWAAACLIICIGLAIFFNKKHDTEITPANNISIVNKPEIKIIDQKSNINYGNTPKPELKKVEKSLVTGDRIRNIKLPVIAIEGAHRKMKDSTVMVIHREPLKVNSTPVINKPDTAAITKLSIVHINNILPGPSPSEVDNKKLLRFMRRYDVDVPLKNSETGSTKNPSIKNIN